MIRCVVLLPLGLAVGCLAPNPEYDPTPSAGATSGGSGGKQGPVGSSSQGAVSDSTTEADSVSGSGVSSAGSADETGPGPTRSSTSSGSTSTGQLTSSSSSGGLDTGAVLEPADLGQDCAASDGCREFGPDVVCCEDDVCLGTCMVPCGSDDECPFIGMGCEHSYCLFPCEANDEDCSDWPGFTCQHGLTYCENDDNP